MPTAVFVGSVGHFVGTLNFKVFGFVGYFYPFLLIYPLFVLYKTNAINKIALAMSATGILLMLLVFTMVFAMVSAKNGGQVGAFFVLKGRQTLGSLGTGVVMLSLFFVSFLLVYGERCELFLRDVFRQVASKFKANLSSVKFTKPKNVPNVNLQPQPPIQPAQTQTPAQTPAPQTQPQTSLFATNANAPLATTPPRYTQPNYNVTNYLKDEIEHEIENINHGLARCHDLRVKQSKRLHERSIVKDALEENFEFEVVEETPALTQETPQTPQTSETNTPQAPAQNKSIIMQEVAENKALLAELEKGKFEKPRDFTLPPLDFLTQPAASVRSIDESEIDSKISNLLEKLRRFKIEGDVVRTYSGPVVTTFEFKPAANIKVSRILTLQDDLAMALKAQTIRIQAPIPGKDVVGIEIPNSQIETIYLREILESEIFKNAKSELTIALGKDIVGDAFVTDLKKLPHLLIAGTTGSGKSVGINSMLLSLLYRNSPQSLRLIMIDPKMLEFSIYNDIPHLLTPVITEPKKAIAALANLVKEMERRYKMMSKTRTKNIESYNEKMRNEGGESLPFIVVIIDELADLMMTSGKEVEFNIGRLAQMARASGIHLIVATQRPSVDVVTGLIKANLPSRISYRVGQKIDSKVILDQMGAESLLGRGDMLFTPPASPGVVRLHAPFASESEIEQIVEFLKAQQAVEYDESYLSEGGAEVVSCEIGEVDELFEQAKSIVYADNKSSISYLQRRLGIGYNRAATIVEQLVEARVLGELNSKGQREILR